MITRARRALLWTAVAAFKLMFGLLVALVAVTAVYCTWLVESDPVIAILLGAFLLVAIGAGAREVWGNLFDR